MRATMARVALGLVALLVLTWLAGSLRALDRGDEASRALAKAGGSGARPQMIDDARRQFSQARRFGDDTDLRLREARGLAYASETKAALELSRRAVRDEPENVEAWILLFATARRVGGEQAAEARSRAVALDPRLDRALPRVSR